MRQQPGALEMLAVVSDCRDVGGRHPTTWVANKAVEHPLVLGVWLGSPNFEKYSQISDMRSASSHWFVTCFANAVCVLHVVKNNLVEVDV